MDTPSPLAERLAAVEARICKACARCGRLREEVTLLAVTKIFPAQAILDAYALGLREFGENYVQEFETKAPEVRSLAGARFHLIGHLQSNKSRKGAELFDVIQTIDSAKLLLKELGKFFGLEKKADSIITTMDAGIAKARDTLNALNIKDSLKVMIIHFGLRNNNYFVMSGRNGVGDKMIRLAGCSPATYDGKGAREMSPEAVALANPDIIIATDFGYDRMGSMDKFISTVPGVALTNAGKNKRIVRFEEHDIVYFGPRSGENIIKLINLLHTPTSASTK